MNEILVLKFPKKKCELGELHLTFRSPREDALDPSAHLLLSEGTPPCRQIV
jgi:hypothetical protein